MALSDDLRERVVEAVVVGGLSRNAAAKRFGVSIASAVRWLQRFGASGEISPAPTGGDRRSGRIEAHRDYLLGLIRRQPDLTLLEIQERLKRGLPPIWRAKADAADEGDGYASAFPTATTRPSRWSPACAFPASWPRRLSISR